MNVHEPPFRPGWASFLGKGLDGQYFQPYSVCYSYSTCGMKQESSHRLHINKWTWLCANKTLWKITSRGPDWPRAVVCWPLTLQHPQQTFTSAAGLRPPLHHSQILSLTLPHTPGHIYFNFEFPQPSVPNPVSAQSKISTNVYQFKRTHAYFPCNKWIHFPPFPGSERPHFSKQSKSGSYILSLWHIWSHYVLSRCSVLKILQLTLFYDEIH